MNVIIKILSSSVDKLNRRVLKYLRYGKSDVQTSLEVAPYGIDSNPIKDLVAVFAETNENGRTVILGYLNKNQKAKPGEWRAFATNAQGDEKFYIWMKDTGIMEIGGDQNYAVKFNELKTEFNKLKDDYNNLVSTFNSHTHILALSAGTGTAAVPAVGGNTNSSDIDNAKNEKIKTI